MHLIKSYIILTLVLLTHVLKATPHEFPKPSKGKSAEIVTNTSMKNQDLSITPILLPNKNHKKVEFYPFIQSISPRFGFMINKDDLKETKTIYSINYLLPKLQTPQWEFGADILPEDGYIHLSKRIIFNERNYFRPYYKYGANLSVVSKENLATFVNIKNYSLRVGTGLEYLTRYPMSIRLELEALIGLEVSGLILTFGYSWGW
jgi:hypothetical protein